MTEDWQLIPTRATFESPSSAALISASGFAEYVYREPAVSSTPCASVTTAGSASHCALVGQLRGAGAVDLAVGEPPDQQRRHDASVLSLRERCGIGRAREPDVLVLADHVLRLAGHAEERRVDLALPVAEPRAGAGADVASALAVGALVDALVLQLDRHVVLVAEHVERAGDDACGAAGAEPRHDDLVIEVVPLGLVGGRRHTSRSIGHASSGKPSARAARSTPDIGPGEGG